MAVTGDTKRRTSDIIAGCQAPSDEHAFYLSQIRAPTPRPTRIQRIPTVQSPRMDENPAPRLQLHNTPHSPGWDTRESSRPVPSPFAQRMCGHTQKIACCACTRSHTQETRCARRLPARAAAVSIDIAGKDHKGAPHPSLRGCLAGSAGCITNVWGIRHHHLSPARPLHTPMRREVARRRGDDFKRRRPACSSRAPPQSAPRKASRTPPASTR